MAKKSIDISNLALFVVLYSKTLKSYHFCRSTMYKEAAEMDQPGYDFEPVDSFGTEEECQVHISSLNEEADDTDTLESMTVAGLKEIAISKGLPEDEWKKLKKADLIEYLKDK